MTDTKPALILRLKKGEEKKVKQGCPWIFAGALVESSEQKLALPGALAELVTSKGEVMGIGYYNEQAQLAFRLLAPKPIAIDGDFITGKLSHALRKREAAFTQPYYRLVHSEADGLPGLVIDRYGHAYVIQISTWGMERLLPLIVDALDNLLAPETIVLRNDFHARDLEGLPREIHVLRGDLPPYVEVKENGCSYLADLLHGQKTGWFYDQRDNRKRIAALAEDKTVLDVYSHTGGFGLLAALQGARRVTLVDSSWQALEIAQAAAENNGISDFCDYQRGDALDIMLTLAEQKKTYDIVVADPPAYIKTKHDAAAGMKGYEKVAKAAAALVEDGGLLMVASCSHHATRPRFREAVLNGVKKAGCIGTVLHYSGHAPDHPVHPQLPQSEYLKALLVRCQKA